jgi:hypothetical protein
MLKVLADFKLCRSYFNSNSNTLQNVKKVEKLKIPPKKNLLFRLDEPTRTKGQFARE